MFRWWRARRRRRLAARPFPAEWEPILAERVPHLVRLDADQGALVRTALQVFVWDKHWIGAHGLAVTDEMKVVIAAAAAELARGLTLDAYDRLTEIVIYPSHYRHPSGDATVFGEVNRWGTMVLSWDAVQHGIANRDDGHDTALHELAHVLDHADGTFDGTPPLETHAQRHAWAKACTQHFNELARRPHKSVIRRYGQTNEAEFFACATEAFFEKPRQLAQRAPDLYDVLRSYYRVDPAAEREAARRRGR